MSDTIIVRAEGLVKSFGGYRAVDGVSVSVERGTIHGILGPNGAGKTTTLRMLLGIIDPDEGSRQVLGARHPRDAAHNIGYLPEERGLYPTMKAREAIAFMGALRGLDWKEGRKRADALLERVGLAHAADLKIRKLSKGMAQFVQVLGSIVHEPQLIVLDEPFSGLDPVNQEHLEKLIRDQRDRGATVLFSTHVMSHAERLCDHLTIIARSRVRFDGTVDEARATLPMRAHYLPKDGVDVSALLPAGAERSGKGWRFTVPDDGTERVVRDLLDAGHGIGGLSIERPGLHDVFVSIVNAADAEGAQ